MNTIMVVDDKKASRKLLTTYLKNAGHHDIIEAESGCQALEMARARKPDLILLDIVMPGISGYEVCSLLKNDPELAHIPVIFLSSLDSVGDKVKAFEKGGVDYLTKPFEFREVKARVETHLKIFNLQKELEKHNRHLERLVDEKLKELYSAQMATIYALACLAEARDYDTGAHLDRTRFLGKILIARLRDSSPYTQLIEDSFAETFHEALPLHDIGKVAVPDAILRKPGKLTPEEFEIIKTHTSVGAKTLQQVKDMYPENRFISMGIDIAHFHHEKWDGSGYPQGLKETEIPLAARIAALIDVYDALRSQRPYKDAYTHEKAEAIILSESGKHFDPVIVEAFMSVKEKFAAVKNY